MKALLNIWLVCWCFLAANSYAQSLPSGDADRSAGDLIQLALPAAGLAAAWWQGDSTGAKQWAYTMAATGLSTQVLKQAFNNTALGERPNGGNQSFPSGHTSSACAGAAFIGRRYGWQYGIPAFVPAAFVAYSRVDEGLHHWRDVVAGCALGATLSYYLTESKQQSLAITPDVLGGHLAVTAVWSF